MNQVDLLEANPTFANIRYPNGRESTVSVRDLDQCPGTTTTCEEQDVVQNRNDEVLPQNEASTSVETNYPPTSTPTEQATTENQDETQPSAPRRTSRNTTQSACTYRAHMGDFELSPSPTMPEISPHVQDDISICSLMSTDSADNETIDDFLDNLSHEPEAADTISFDQFVEGRTAKDYNILNIAGGCYYHFVIEKWVKTMIFTGNVEEVSIQVNIDGLPLFKSSGAQFWPILGKLVRPQISKPFIIGLFSGVSKPSNLFEYLEHLVTELDNLFLNGILISETAEDRVVLSLSCVICDAPAKAYIKQIKGHSGYSGCDQCSQDGYWNKKMTFPETNAALRTDVSFAEKQDEEHHIGRTPFSNLPVGMVSQFPPDPIYLGVVKRMIGLCMKGPVANASRIGSNAVKGISDHLVQLRGYLPRKFNRKARTFYHVERWKATEFRQFLLYTGPVVLIKHLSPAKYRHFMLLFAMYLVLEFEHTDEVAMVSEKWLKNDKTEVMWPNYKSSYKLEIALKQHKHPEADWTRWGVKRILYTRGFMVKCAKVFKRFQKHNEWNDNRSLEVLLTVLPDHLADLVESWDDTVQSSMDKVFDKLCNELDDSSDVLTKIENITLVEDQVDSYLAALKQASGEQATEAIVASALLRQLSAEMRQSAILHTDGSLVELTKHVKAYFKSRRSQLLIIGSVQRQSSSHRSTQPNDTTYELLQQVIKIQQQQQLLLTQTETLKSLDFSHNNTTYGDRRTVRDTRNLRCYAGGQMGHNIEDYLLHFYVTVAIAEHLLGKYISVPQGDNLLNVISKFERRCGFPQIGGAIDGSYVKIIAPHDSHSDFCNRHHNHSVILLAVVDCDCKFLDVCVGWLVKDPIRKHQQVKLKWSLEDKSIIEKQYQQNKPQDICNLFNFCHLNARSINNKSLQIKDYVVDESILSLTETWLNDNDSNSDFALRDICPNGFSLLHCPRINRTGVGSSVRLEILSLLDTREKPYKCDLDMDRKTYSPLMDKDPKDQQHCHMDQGIKMADALITKQQHELCVEADTLKAQKKMEHMMQLQQEDF
ncbi:hypothetical protein GQR58_007598 [Nymphon striatum]|nr:hypothetical protein GQR58_007598 [Nymphon striatum]